MSLSPIVLFVYNRPEHTKKTLEALQENKLATESLLFIYSDASKDHASLDKVNEVRSLIKNVTGFKSVTVIQQEKNQGLANSIINGVTDLINKYGKIIVLEDDLITSSYFLTFMNQALNFYESDESIFVVSGYSPSISIPKNYAHDVYLTHRSSSWGWGTWKNEWNSICWDELYIKKRLQNKKLLKEFGKKGGTDRAKMLLSQINGDIDSWAVRRGFSQFLQKKYTLFPKFTLVKNIGHDETGVHCGKDDFFIKIKMKENFSPLLVKNLIENKKINKKIYSNYSLTLFKKINNKIRRLLSSE